MAKNTGSSESIPTLPFPDLWSWSYCLSVLIGKLVTWVAVHTMLVSPGACYGLAAITTGSAPSAMSFLLTQRGPWGKSADSWHPGRPLIWLLQAVQQLMSDVRTLGFQPRLQWQFPKWSSARWLSWLTFQMIPSDMFSQCHQVAEKV